MYRHEPVHMDETPLFRLNQSNDDTTNLDYRQGVPKLIAPLLI